MKISLNWLKSYLKTDLEPSKIGEILTDIGLEVEGEEEIQTIEGGLAGLVVGEVLTCGRHPNADRLSLTTVNVGREEPLQIVCGAPNVAAGQKVIVATPGTTLHPTAGDAFTIKSGKIRGEKSEGMICAEDEIGIGTSHDGIIVLPETIAVGTTAADYYGVETDYIYEIGLTPNRSDATSHLGVAKDLAAALQINFAHQDHLQIPSVADFKIDNTNHPVQVKVEDTDACPRYSGLTITNLTIAPSPDWLKNRLLAIGVRPISNVVDVTNFILHELGQPLHAFDLSKITGQTIIVKKLPAGSKFVTLDEQERELTGEDLMICDGKEQGMCIGGVFGGLNSGVTDSTTSIFLEAAHFDAKTLRRSSFHHDLRTDAAKVFEKGSDPNLTVFALQRAALLLKELAGGVISSEIVDIYPKPVQPTRIKLNYAYANRLIGADMNPEEMQTILRALRMEIVASDAESLTAAVPTDKADVTRPADLVEEILRIYGFNQVPVSNRLNASISTQPYPNPQEIRNRIAELLLGQGFMEMMALSLSESKYYEQFAMPDVSKSDLVYINNTSNVHLDIMRPSMLFSSLEAVVRNQNRQRPDLRLFEFGKTYRNAEEGHTESQRLTLTMTGRREAESWRAADNEQVSLYTLKAVVENVLTRLGLSGFQSETIQNEQYVVGQRYFRGPKELVTFGQVHKQILRGMDIRNDVLFADFDLDTLIRSTKKGKVKYSEISKYPNVRRDLALVVDEKVKFEQVLAIAKKTGKKLLREVNLFSVFADAEKLGAGKKSYAVSYIFEDKTKTLKDKEVDKTMNALIKQYEEQLGAIIRR